MNPIGKAKGRLYQKSLFERVGVCMSTHERESANQMRVLSVFTWIYRLRAPIVSQTLIRATRVPIRSEQRDQSKEN